MPYAIDETHNPELSSWVESANDPASAFPIQNLPLCVARGRGVEPGRGAVAVVIGDSVITLAAVLSAAGELGFSSELARCGLEPSRLDLAGLTPSQRRVVRRATSAALRSDLDGRRHLEHRLMPLHEAQIEPLLSARRPHPGLTVGDYTDFYASVYHATNVGSMFRPDHPLLPNYKWIPVGYHGRASSIVSSGTPIIRPQGQKAPVEEGASPTFGPCRMLDYELEIGVVIGRGNELGQPIPMAEAEDHVLGLCLLNDWSARDVQKWEYQPLGPFLAKNFATTISPFVVTMEALAPFRCAAMERPAGDPQPLPHLDEATNRKAGGFDITLEVHLSTRQMRERGMTPVRISRGNFRDMYWTVAQMVAHHTSNGCNLQPGDLLGSGTISGPTRQSRGCLLELTWDGDPFADPPVIKPGTSRTPIQLPTGETRTFLDDGDEVIIRGYCEREGYRRIGFGECRGVIEPARS
ncbi:MAG: fumarylacetoacetase [Phycisphaerales bacterium]